MAMPKPANNSESSLPSSSPPGRKEDDTKPFTADNGGGDAAGHGYQGLQPFVQLASWGHGSFTPLAQFGSGVMLLGGGGGSEKGSGGWSAPSAVGAAAGLGAECQVGSGQEERCGNRGRTHAIRTREGSLDIAPATGEQRTSGIKNLRLQWLASADGRIRTRLVNSTHIPGAGSLLLCLEQVKSPFASKHVNSTTLLTVSIVLKLMRLYFQKRRCKTF